MTSLVVGLFGVGILLSLALCWLGVTSFRRWNEPGTKPFAVFVVLLGLGGVVAGGASIRFGPLTSDEMVIWSQVSFLALMLWSVPWGLFGLQYTGRLTRLRWRTVAALTAPIVLITFPIVGIVTRSDFEPPLLFQLVSGLVFLYALFLLGTGVYLLLQTTYSFGHLSLVQGVTLCAAPIAHFALLNVANSTQIQESALSLSTLYVVSYVAPALALGVALFRQHSFESAPAVGTIGERTITEQTEDLVFVVDDSEQVVKLNETAVETLDVSRGRALGTQLAELIVHDIDDLRGRETVGIDVANGTRRYDVHASAITDQHDRDLGHLVMLHDVTEHELREQRLTVLNRVLRHNLRNKVEVVKSHAEILEETHENGHAETIVDTADKIADLGDSARAIDQFVSHANTDNEVDLVDFVERMVTTVGDGRDDVIVTLDLPESAPVETNREALYAALESAIENALQYADSSVAVSIEQRADEYEIAIVDDGPGIPEGELASLDAGTETALEHGTGLGLWQLKWAVTTMGGELEFETSDGTTVTFNIPDQRAVETTQGS